MSGRFITFEGIDGAGKSSHIEPLAAALRARGRAVRCTREPGGTPLAEALREVILARPMDAVSETLLVFAARRDHIERVIRPALAEGDIVLCDRFTDATFAYQGGGRGLPGASLAALEAWVQGDLQPDLTLWFDADPLLAADRRARVRRADRFEAEDLGFFERVRAAYDARRLAAPKRIVRIDADGDLASVQRRVDAAVQAFLGSAWRTASGTA